MLATRFVIISTLLFPVSIFAANIEDTSIIDELEKNTTDTSEVSYTLESFESCEVFEDVIWDYMKTYWENSYKDYRYRSFWGPVMMEMESVDSAVMNDTAQSLSPATKQSGSAEDIYQTNTQVLWVDEADIVKTDGNYHYYYNQTQQAVFIVEVSWNELELVKKIKLPKSFYGIELYIDENRLSMIASSYSQTDYSKRGYYIDRNTKTYTIVFDTQDKQNPELIKLFSSDGNYKSSRKIGDYLYVLSTNYFNYPYYNISSVDDIQIDAEKFLPKKLDISKTDNTSLQNLTIQWKTLPYKASWGNVADCRSISYSFPSEETIKNGWFNPGYNIVSVINMRDISREVETTVIAWSNSEIYMSQDNLYMTEGIWSADRFNCPPNARCAMPFFWWGTQNTLVHKLGIDTQKISYQESALVPGSPLNQYSMDEYEGNFRIITSAWTPERSTGLYILDENLQKVSSLTDLAPGETFQSSRFIGDKLFLVTFEQIDPLFAIDLSDSENPTVLGELKIPWFSTYLHPYDENHLIGLWYDTQVNTWWGTQTAGVKIDLYIGGKWSYSEALSNPRMFVWNKNRNTLLLPATLYEKDDSWRTLDYYNGLFAINIDKETGIQVKNKTTHIDISEVEEKRKQECSKYDSSWEPTCRELLNGELYCEEEKEYTGRVPNYCFKDASVWSYVWDKSWEYNSENIKRALYVWENVYALSDTQISSHDWNLTKKQSIKFE